MITASCRSRDALGRPLALSGAATAAGFSAEAGAAAVGAAAGAGVSLVAQAPRTASKARAMTLFMRESLPVQHLAREDAHRGRHHLPITRPQAPGLRGHPVRPLHPDRLQDLGRARLHAGEPVESGSDAEHQAAWQEARMVCHPVLLLRKAQA